MLREPDIVGAAEAVLSVAILLYLLLWTYLSESTSAAGFLIRVSHTLYFAYT
ncbi:hypothetical protein [Pontibacter flavimaris]|uniref:hypothetical protein n=1 Tax=Pontibacter flavimaris TaxID=1797110 RepID=UPI001479DFC9|nr:hypothetical protein [Pontibacter flavimaris]